MEHRGAGADEGGCEQQHPEMICERQQHEPAERRSHPDRQRVRAGLAVCVRTDDWLQQRRRDLERERQEADLPEAQGVGRLEHRVERRQQRLHHVVQQMAEADRCEDVEGGRGGGGGWGGGERAGAGGGGVFHGRYPASSDTGDLSVSRGISAATSPLPVDIIRTPYGIYRKAPVSDEDIQAELQRLRAENELLKKSGRSKLAMKVSEKGALSVYGMGRFPVTLYKEQWIKLLDMGDEIRAFIEANKDSLKAKE